MGGPSLLEIAQALLELGEAARLLQEDGQERPLEGEQGLSFGDGGDVAVGGGQEVIQEDLIAAAQGAAEALEQGFGLVEGLGDGRYGASHRITSPEGELGGKGGGLRVEEERGGAAANGVQERAAGGVRRRGEGEHQGGALPQPLALGQAALQQHLGLGQGERVIVERGQEIQHHQRDGGGGQGLQGGRDLMGGEGALQVQAREPVRYVHRVLADQAGQEIGLEADAGIEQVDGATLEQGHHEAVGGGGERRAAAEDDQLPASECRELRHHP